MILDFFVTPKTVNMATFTQIIAGIFIGLMAFVISLHGIPVGDMRPVDVRYLPVYFSVFYGSSLIGTSTAITLVISKGINYYISGGTLTEIVNNIIITFLILIISILIVKKELSPKKAIYTCLTFTILVRTLFFVIAFYPVFNFSTIVQIINNFVIFSCLFLFTGWLVNRAILISEGIHVYRTSSVFDHLTKLYNKESFYFFLDLAYNEAIHEGRSFSLAIIDFDDFKQVNDTYGHLVGDDALIQVAQLLQNQLSPNSRIRPCRIGGDEFAIVFKHEIYDASEYFENVFKDLEKISLTTDKHIPITLSVGLIDFHPVNHEEEQYESKTVQELFHLADAALYQAKKSGKGQIIQSDVSIEIIQKNR